MSRAFVFAHLPRRAPAALARALPLGIVLLALLPDSARAQHMFVDTNGDSMSSSADRMNGPGIPTTVRIWIRTDQNADGSTAECNMFDGPLSINSYEVILHAAGGTVSYGSFTNLRPTMTSPLGSASSSTDFYVGWGGGTYLAAGLYQLGTLQVTVSSGNPALQIVASTPLVSTAVTSFGTLCSGMDGDYTYKLGLDWFDTSGAAANATPVLSAPANVVGAEGSPLSFGATATDLDAGDVLTISASGAPGSLSFSHTPSVSPTSASFSGTLGYTDAGSYTITWQVSDGVHAPVTATTSLNVSNTDRPPTIIVPATASGAEGSVLTVNVSASDPDGEAVMLSADLSGLPSPNDAAFSSTGPPNMPQGMLTWTPAYDHAGSYSVTFTASNALSANGATAITIANTDRPPTITAPPTANGAEASLLTVNVSAQDPDGEAVTLSADLSGLPSPNDAVFSSTGPPNMPQGMLTWTPAYDHAGSYSVTFTASNALSVSGTTSITITNTDRPPDVSAPASASGREMTLITFGVTATDPDLDAIASLTLDASGLPPSSGATFTANGSNTAGTFSWTPGLAHAGTHVAGFTASNALSGSASTSITVVDDVPPTVAITSPGEPTSVNEGQTITIVVNASDDVSVGSLAFEPVDLPTVNDAGMAVNGTNTQGTFTWTPTFSDARPSPYRVRFRAVDGVGQNAIVERDIAVVNVNRPPVLDPVPPLAVNETATLDQPVQATDPDGDGVTLSLLGEPPFVTLLLDPPGPSTVMGTIRAQPGPNAAEGQPTKSWNFGLRATDDASGGSAYSDRVVQLTVNRTNSPPQLGQVPPDSVSVNETETAVHEISATDADTETTSLTFQLVGAPPFCTVETDPQTVGTSVTGRINFTPGPNDAGTYCTSLVVEDSEDGSAAFPFCITVSPTNSPPFFTQPPPLIVTLSEGEVQMRALVAADHDSEQQLTLSLVGAPPYCTVSTDPHTPGTPATGTLTIAPGYTDAGSACFDVRVQDSGAVPASASASVCVTVNNVDRPPAITVPATASGVEGSLLTVSVSAQDPDGDAITLSADLSGLPSPSDAVFTVIGPPEMPQGNLTWTPAYDHAGSYPVLFTAANALSDSGTTTITIANTDRPPTITVPPTASGAEGSLLTVNVSAQDPDGEAVMLSADLSGLPSPNDAAFSSTGPPNMPQGMLTWTPGYDHAGSYSVSFTASNTLSDLGSTNITIANTDRPPVLDPIPAELSACEGSTLDIPLSASDPDGGPISFAAELPAYATIIPGSSTPGPPSTATGTLRIQPGPNAAGCDPSKVWCFSVTLADTEDVAVQALRCTGEPTAMWTHVTGSTPATPLPAPQEGEPVCGGLSYVAAGNVLTALRSERLGGSPAGTPVWTRTLPANIQNFTSPVPLSATSGGGLYIFITGSDGRVHKVNAQTGDLAGSSPDLRRTSCLAEDQILATPAVQLYDFSSASFQSSAGEDLVFVATYYGCVTTTHNRIFAFHASNLTVKWTFNEDGLTAVDRVAEGCAIDYTRNQLYCGSDLQPPATGQNSLWAIRTTDGGLAWARALGPIASIPGWRYEPADGPHVYAVSRDGMLRALDPAAPGAIVWSINAASAGSSVSRNLWPEFRPESSRDRILVIDDAGVLRAFDDMGGSATQVWTTRASQGAITSPTASGSLGRCWIGLNDGKIWELDLETGQHLTSVAEAPDGPLGPPVFRPLPGSSAGRLVVTSGGTLRRYTVPWGSVGSPTGVESPPGEPAPRRLSLDRVVPNPFNPSSRIEYSVPKAGRVTLSIFDVRGRFVLRLADRVEGPGRRSVTWDGRDREGRPVASGLYVARLEAAGEVSTRKLVLAK